MEKSMEIIKAISLTLAYDGHTAAENVKQDEVHRAIFTAAVLNLLPETFAKQNNRRLSKFLFKDFL